MAVMLMDHQTDPKEKIRAGVGDLSKIRLRRQDLLVGIYKRPERTASGLYLSDGVRKEDDYQGKVGLVLAVGPNCFEDDDKYSFFGFRAEVGDWIVIKPSESWRIDINSKDGHCRVVTDTDVRMVVDTPDMVL